MRTIRFFISVILLGVIALIAFRFFSIQGDWWVDESMPEDLVKMAKKYPQTREFVRGYGKEHAEVAVDITDEMQEGWIPYFRQWDHRWGYRSYSNNIIGVSGCGPTTLSMVLVGLTRNPEWNPAEVAQFSVNRGYVDKEGSTYWSLMDEGATALGLGVRVLEAEESAMRAVLDAGQPIIALMGPGDFTESGHFIVITGYDDKGFKLLDSMNDKNNDRRFSFETLHSQSFKMWTYWY